MRGFPCGGSFDSNAGSVMSLTRKHFSPSEGGYAALGPSLLVDSGQRATIALLATVFKVRRALNTCDSLGLWRVTTARQVFI